MCNFRLNVYEIMLHELTCFSSSCWVVMATSDAICRVAMLGSGSLAAMAVFESRYQPDMEVCFIFSLLL